MASDENNVAAKLKNITECCICFNTFTDPRILPCIHTFCLKCLQEIGSKSGKKSGDTISCPICRKEFTIPMEGFEKTPKNFFMENLIEMTKISKSVDNMIYCDECQVTNDEAAAETPSAIVYCVDCQENFCANCVRCHKIRKATKNHQIVEMGEKMNEKLMKDMRKPLACDQHPSKVLDYYCTECKNVICVSCFVENHNSHKCLEVGKVSEEFRHAIERDIDKVGECVVFSLFNLEQLKIKREAFLREVDKSEKAILKRSEELKEMLDRHTKFLLDELIAIKQTQLKEMEIENGEIETQLSVMENFKLYCSELTYKGSPGDICCSAIEIQARTKEMEVYHTKNITSDIIVKVSFNVTNLEDFLKINNSNAIGSVKLIVTESEETMIIVGEDLDSNIFTKDVLKMSLHRSNAVSKLDSIPIKPTKFWTPSAAAVYNNSLFVTGVRTSEIWKYDLISKWSKCGSINHGRYRHCATFLENILYISGGFQDYPENVLDIVEAYNTSTNKCTTVGKLKHAVQYAAAVSCGNLIYVFGGMDKDMKTLDYVQVYDTHLNGCYLTSKPMPRPCSHMRAVLWEKSVIILDRFTCFIYNLETETWQEREQFKTDVVYFGLTLGNDKIFVVGGGLLEKDGDGKEKWKRRDDVRCVPVMNIINDQPIAWKIHAKLPNSSLVHAFGRIIFPIQ